MSGYASLRFNRTSSDAISEEIEAHDGACDLSIQQSKTSYSASVVGGFSK